MLNTLVHKPLIHEGSRWVMYNATVMFTGVYIGTLVFGKGSIISPERFVDIHFVR